MISNYKEFKLFLKTIENRPKLLLHSCCGPCSSHVLELLNNYFSITIFYSNDCIFPLEEYYHRLHEQIKIVQEMNLDINIVIPPYDKADYNKAVKGQENLGEHSIRCYSCFLERLTKTAKYAADNQFSYFTTTLSISPYKNSSWLNEIGYKLEREYGIKYLYSDFKKEDGYKRSIALSKEYDLYRQDYCGCIYSLNERGLKK